MVDTCQKNVEKARIALSYIGFRALRRVESHWASVDFGRGSFAGFAGGGGAGKPQVAPFELTVLAAMV
ncbi:hypothetical protein PBI_MOSMORIS_1 [Mycobacterium phage MosMoris]|uniref:Uncharacterized protein n=2 Tax=Marvinvirus mosmoris TaxID=1982093 RepID=A0A023ZY25_9CAUD|nr:hypothetical protein FH33_gp001 [Mycobacterium phage MosMoris]AHY84075.1 hypothetical protein PBI_MOSMORIS_1 [Mycobacterium phage MosMoris]ANM46225.1 hypothetical protein SEA_GATTACA_1 [Mycobacterium phage Gattaca]